MNRNTQSNVSAQTNALAIGKLSDKVRQGEVGLGDETDLAARDREALSDDPGSPQDAN